MVSLVSVDRVCISINADCDVLCVPHYAVLPGEFDVDQQACVAGNQPPAESPNLVATAAEEAEALHRSSEPKTSRGVTTRCGKTAVAEEEEGLHCSSSARVCEEKEGLHGVHRRLRRDKHPKTKEGC
jgi:hypothetical protein